MTRVKWLNFKDNANNSDFKKLTKSLKNLSYADDASTGFIVDELRKNYLCSRFITKRIVKQNLETPFGDFIEQEFILYETTQFRIDDVGPGLELINPPRTTSMFVNQLSLAANFSITISDINIDLKKWISNISKKSTNLKLNSLECKDIKIGSNLIGSLSVSGSGDIEKEIKNILGNKKYTLNRVKLSIDNCSVILSNNCSAQIGAENKEKVTQILRSTIPKI